MAGSGNGDRMGLAGLYRSWPRWVRITVPIVAALVIGIFAPSPKKPATATALAATTTTRPVTATTAPAPSATTVPPTAAPTATSTTAPPPTTAAPMTAAPTTAAPTTEAPTTTTTTAPPAGQSDKGWTVVPGSVLTMDDGTGDFGGTVRIMNTNDSAMTGVFILTLFRGPDQIATMQGSAQGVSAGQTVTVQMVSTNPYSAAPYTSTFQTDVSY